MAVSDLMGNTAPHTHVGCTQEYYNKVIAEMDSWASGVLLKWLTVSLIKHVFFTKYINKVFIKIIIKTVVKLYAIKFNLYFK